MNRILHRAVIVGLIVVAVPQAGLAQVSGVTPPPNWDRFLILVWQFKTNAERDLDLYRDAGFRGFHIDYGADRSREVEFAARQGLPYYVDHAAGKGILHLTERTGLGQLPDDGRLAARPQSLVDPAVWDRLVRQLQANLAVTRNGPIVAVALDDEVSLGVFNSPLEVDGSPKSVAMYREWLKQQYESIERLNAQWQTSHRTFAEVNPVPFGDLRERHRAPPLLAWNLAPWMDWRSYMDSQFADVLAQLTGQSNQLAPAVPAGIVGGQQPAPYGGFDYEKLRHSLQWIESYDIGGTNEILRSFWSYPESRPRVQTFFSTGNARQDAWFLWYYLLHGNRAVIAWPDRNGQSWFGDKRLAPFIADNRTTFRELQSDRIAPLFDANCRFDADRIAVLYSHPSVQASWATDVVTHGKTWPRRSSSLDNGCQTAGKNRVAWFKLLEDCGFQYEVVSDADLVRGVLQEKNIRVLILPRAIAMSDDHCQAVRQFVRDGGTVIADYWVALMDQHGTGRATGGGLDSLFGVQRDESPGYFNGQTITEIDGEKYQRPLLERLPSGNVLRHRQCMVVERGTHRVDAQAAATIQNADVVIQRPVARGRAVYLNLSPVEYYANQVRLDGRGAEWRDLLTRLLADADLHPRARVFSDGEPVPMTELLFWQRGDSLWLGLVKNPSRQASVDGANGVEQVAGPEIEIEIRLAAHYRSIRNVRTDSKMPGGDTIRAPWRPSEGLLFELTP